MKKLLKEPFHPSHIKLLVNYQLGHVNRRGDYGPCYFEGHEDKAKSWLIGLTRDYPISRLTDPQLHAIYVNVLFYASDLEAVRALNEMGSNVEFYQGMKFILCAIGAGIYPWDFDK